MPTAEYTYNICQVDKVGGKEQRHANCAGYLDGLLENTLSFRLHFWWKRCITFVAGSVVLGKMGASKTRRET